MAGVRPVFGFAGNNVSLFHRNGREVMPLDRWRSRMQPEYDLRSGPEPLVSVRAGLILGLNLPGPHAVLATADGWWSWGEPYDPGQFPGAVIEEAWAVTWS